MVALGFLFLSTYTRLSLFIYLHGVLSFYLLTRGVVVVTRGVLLLLIVDLHGVLEEEVLGCCSLFTHTRYCRCHAGCWVDAHY